MADTVSVRCDDGIVLFTFFAGPRLFLEDPPNQMVQITVGSESRELPIWKFNQEMLLISEIAARRSRHGRATKS